MRVNRRSLLMLRLRTFAVGLGASAVVAGLLPASAMAATGGMGGMSNQTSIGADSFFITYYATRADGSRGRQLTTQDFEFFYNRARCQCNHAINAKVQIKPGNFGTNFVSVFAGLNCADAQTTLLPQYQPCVTLETRQIPQYQQRPADLSFSPVWLGTGVAGRLQNIEEATPERDCNTATEQSGGIWICVQGMSDLCQKADFIVTGTQSVNSMEAKAVRVDYRPPNTTNIAVVDEEGNIDDGQAAITAVGGDGAVTVGWGQTATSDIYGFRVLCANADGSPVPGKGFGGKALDALNTGDIYYTQGNLCGYTPFPHTNAPPEETPPPEGETPDPEGETLDLDENDESTSAMLEFQGPPSDWVIDPDDDALYGTTGTTGGYTGTTYPGYTTDGYTGTTYPGYTTEGTGTTYSGYTTDGDLTEGGVDETDSAGGEPGEPLEEFPRTGIKSLDWSYVCSDSLSTSSRSARISGLQNGQSYQFLLVAYDRAGNPAIVGDVLEAAPQPTTDLWEACERQGNVCGDGGFCSVDPKRSPGLPALSLLACGFLGMLARRRRGGAKAS